jgi:putative endonuclease
MSRFKDTVYILRSLSIPHRFYTGVTSDLTARLADHNAGRSPHTSSGRPWTVDVTVKFADEARALRFEQYLKSGSGTAFATRHLRSK